MNHCWRQPTCQGALDALTTRLRSELRRHNGDHLPGQLERITVGPGPAGSVGPWPSRRLVLCEQYRNEENRFWFRDSTGIAAINIRSRAKFLVTDNGAGDGFVWIRCNQRTWVSCYLSPNGGMDVYRERLAYLEDAITGLRGELIAAGDINSTATG